MRHADRPVFTRVFRMHAFFLATVGMGAMLACAAARAVPITGATPPVAEKLPETVLAFAAVALPTMGVIGLCIVAIVCALAGAFIIMRKG